MKTKEYVISLENKERLFLLKLINKEVKKAKQEDTPVNKLTMLFDLQAKLIRKGIKDDSKKI